MIILMKLKDNRPTTGVQLCCNISNMIHTLKGPAMRLNGWISLFMIVALNNCYIMRALRIPPQKSKIMMSITKGTIIGGGRIGEHLYNSNKQSDVFVNSRDSAIPCGSGPIYVCTRNNDLEAIIEKTPQERREDLVFLQNGMLTNYLKSKGLESNTQALIYYAISSKGATPIDGMTDLNPEGLTAVTGKWASDFDARMKQAGLSCHEYDKYTWTVAMVHYNDTNNYDNAKRKI